MTLRRDVPYDTVYYLRENQARFPGVSVERVYVRHYPQGTLAAHLLGYVGEVAPEQLKDPRYEALQPGDQVGQDGVEYAYDSLLRGINGETRVQVDAAGQPTGGRLSEREPTHRQRPRALDRRRRPARRRGGDRGRPGCPAGSSR